MAKLEKEARVLRRRANIQKVVLQTVAGAGMLSLALLAPDALQALRIFDRGLARKMNPKYLVASTFSKLCINGMLVVTKTTRGKNVQLTPKGKVMLARMVANSPDSRSHGRWDKRWRMVVYDICEKRRGTRGRLRDTLSAFGFYKLQASTWIYPYECEELLILLKAEYKIGQDVLYIVVEKVENDQKLKDHFGLR